LRVLLDGLFEHPAWLFCVVSHLDICDDHRGQNEFFRSLLGLMTQAIGCRDCGKSSVFHRGTV